MQLRLFINLLFVCSPTMYAMELTIVPDDLLTTAICSRLDRPARDTLRCASKKYFNLILSQDTLNKNYKKADILQKTLKRIYWKNMGGLLSHQEFANAIKKERKLLAGWLLAKEKVSVFDAYCSNIKEAAELKTVNEILPVIRWLLYTRKPSIYLDEFLNGYNYANNLKKQYPDVQKIVDLFNEYKEYKEKEARELHKGGAYVSYSGLRWHARGDYF